MRKHKKFLAVVLTFCLTLLVSGTAMAATPGQALDAKEVKYGTLTKADQTLLKSMFNAEYYAAQNEDVVKAVGKNADALFAHFVKYGLFEGRAVSKDFNVSAYKSSYGDLQKAFGSDIMAYYRHYNGFGKKEKRELITVEKAEAAGVVIKSVVAGATKTIPTPSQEAAKSGSSSSSSTTTTTTTTSPSSSPAVPATGVTITESNSTLASTTATLQLHATTVPSGQAVTWTSSEESYATVSSSGLVQGVAEGQTVITATITVSGNDYTDTVTITVPGAGAPADTTPPTLSNGSVTRTSDTAATISFTASEAGAYYIEVVDDGASAPTIDTTGAGTTMASGANADIAVTLTAGAKDIYVTAKDAAGNVATTALKIDAAAYVAPLTLTITANDGASFTENATSAGKTFTVSAATGDMTGLDIAWTLEGDTHSFLSLSNDTTATVTVAFDEDAYDIDADQTVTLKVTVGTVEKTTSITIAAE